MWRRQAGFSLIELVVGMALTVIVMAGLATLLTGLLGHGVRGVDLTDRQQEARWVLDMVAQEVRFATLFHVTSNNTVIDFEKNDTDDAPVRVRYHLQQESDGSGRFVLIRSVWIPASAEAPAAVNPVGNPDRGMVGAGDFSAVVNQAAKQVTRVDLTYRLRREAADASPVIMRTSVYPLNNPQIR